MGRFDQGKEKIWEKPLHMMSNGMPDKVDMMGNNRLLEAFADALAKGGDPNYCDSAVGIPLLSRVASNGCVNVAELLLQAGSEVNATDHYSRSSLMAAIGHFRESKSVEMIELLLEHGANVNQQDHCGDTPFYQFARLPDSASPVLLSFLEKGIDQTLMHNHGNIIELLRNEAPEETVAMIDAYFENKKLSELIAGSGQHQQVCF